MYDQAYSALIEDLVQRGHAGKHAGLQSCGIWPDAADQPGRRPRPLAAMLDDLFRRRRSERGPRRRPERPDRRRAGRAAGRAGRSRGDDFPQPGARYRNAVARPTRSAISVGRFRQAADHGVVLNARRDRDRDVVGAGLPRHSIGDCATAAGRGDARSDRGRRTGLHRRWRATRMQPQTESRRSNRRKPAACARFAGRQSMTTGPSCRPSCCSTGHRRPGSSCLVEFAATAILSDK